MLKQKNKDMQVTPLFRDVKISFLYPIGKYVKPMLA